LWYDFAPFGRALAAWHRCVAQARDFCTAFVFPAMWLTTLVLLTISNVFMTFAWYGHLKYKTATMGTAILVSWLIALVEYCFQVPANRIGHDAGITTAQLKTLQEVVTLSVFCGFSVLYLKEPLRWNYLVGFALVAAGALFVFAPWERLAP